MKSSEYYYLKLRDIKIMSIYNKKIRKFNNDNDVFLIRYITDIYKTTSLSFFYRKYLMYILLYTSSFQNNVLRRLITTR